ncbi:MAG: hypothetical protein ABR587_11525 [Candidatus Binatia bacterium]
MRKYMRLDSDHGLDQTARHSRSTVSAVALLAAAALLSTAALASAEDAPATPLASAAEAAAPTEEAPAAVVVEETETVEREYKLRGRILGTGAIVNGDVAQFQQRHRIPEDISGGIDELYFATEIAEDTLLEFEGRAIFDNHDYLMSLSIENEDKGYFKAGYREFRTWYDGRGGYFPPADASFTVFDPKLGIDRGEAWAKGGLVLPADFKLTVGYRYLSRDGSKDSVSWGDTTQLGLAPPANRRNIVPAFWEIDENRHLVNVGLDRQTETSTVGTGFYYEYTSLDDRRHMTREPGVMGVERRLTERDNSDSNLWGSRLFGSRRLFDGKVTVSGAYAYNDIDLNPSGSRIYGASFNSQFNPVSPNRQQRDEGFFDLGGNNKLREHVGNMSMMASPFENVQVVAAIRVRGENMDSNAHFTESNVGAGPAFTTALEELATFSSRNEVSYAEDLEVRYKGIDNVVLYARGQWEQNNGDLYENESAHDVIGLERSTDIDRDLQKYAVGAKYYPTRWMNVSTEYSYRLSDYDYQHDIDSTPNEPVGPPPSSDRYPAFIVSQDFATHDFNVRSTFRLPGDVSLVARYDWLQSTIDTKGDMLSREESAETRTHMLGGTVTWNPANWWWTRGGVNYVLSTVDTASNNYNTPVAGFLRSFDNNYVMANLATGMALDANTDAEFLYTFTNADNYYGNVNNSSLAYGSRFEEHGVRVKVARRLSDNTKLAASYGYFDNDEAFAGGQYNYDAHIITTSLEFDY